VQAGEHATSAPILRMPTVLRRTTDPASAPSLMLFAPRAATLEARQSGRREE
jgi:hypothetical protein